MLDPLPGTPEAKARLAAIIATISGEKSIPDVCRELGIGEARFHELRKEFLAGALGLLERQTAGRKVSSADVPPELARLRDENGRLHLELEAAQIRAEIAAVMPHVLKPPASSDGSKKKREKRR
jgi:transposase-like protein